MKCCTACGLQKPLDDFYPDPRRRDGRRAKCKACFPRSEWKGRTDAQREQRAIKRRITGESQGEYMPKSERMAQAAAKRAELEAARHDAHVKVWDKQQERAVRRSLHDAHVIVFKSPRVRWIRNYATSPEFAAKERLRNQLKKKAKLYPQLCDVMRAAINRGGGSRMVEVVCGYTISELVRHLESLFVDGMDWARFMAGEIHIDHVRPQSSFDLTDEAEVRACWALSNLQPLWARDNIVKGARLDWAGARTKEPGSSQGFFDGAGIARRVVSLATAL